TGDNLGGTADPAAIRPKQWANWAAGFLFCPAKQGGLLTCRSYVKAGERNVKS
ncbi:hypothetical protein EVA_13482, partial [gut metagenome]